MKTPTDKKIFSHFKRKCFSQLELASKIKESESCANVLLIVSLAREREREPEFMDATSVPESI
jgi:hypothetical protein